MPKNNTIDLVFAIHNHQPMGNFDFVIEQTFKDSYEPFLSALEKHPKIKKVNYPGLKSHPQYELNKKQATGYGAIISFEYDGDVKKTAKVVESTKIFKLAESLGAVESLIEHPRTMSHSSVSSEQLNSMGISENLIRISVGIENIEDLINDLDQALNRS